MKVTTAEEMRVIDRATTERAGVPSFTLMQNAGAEVSAAITDWFPVAGNVLVVCGKGNNGGDGFVVARLLAEQGRDVEVVLLAEPTQLSGDAAEAFGLWQGATTAVTTPELVARELVPRLDGTDLIVDAILGTGFHPPVTGLYAVAIEEINRAEAPVLAIDIPSGADSDSVEPQRGQLVARCNAIVTFTAPRPAHLFGELTRGPLRVASIGSPDEVIESDLKLHLITPRDVAPLLAPRDVEGHKGNYGHALIIGGSVGKTGAAGMAALSAMRAGAGLATVATPKSAVPMVAACAMEIMTEPLAETDAGTVSMMALEYGRLDAMIAGKNVVAIGPGISRNSDTEQFVRAAVTRHKSLPLVLDADGLSAFEHYEHMLDGRGRALVLTPHPGEMARLASISTGEVQRNRLDVARRFARERGVIVVLKGRRTLVAAPDGTTWVNPTGNPGMATGGSGDVLTGIIAGLIAQFPSDVMRAVAGAVYLHGMAGDIACERLGEQAMLATDILNALPAAMRRTRELARRNYVELT